jgi:hypothetical protein
MSAVSISTTLSVTATRTPTPARGVTINTGLKAVAATTPTFNQSLSIQAALAVTATRKPTLYPPLEFFTVTGNLNAIVTDYVDADADPDQHPISASVVFTPRIPVGTIIWIPGQGVALAPIRARFDSDGILRTIQGGTGVELVANTPVLDLDQLIYDVVFTNVTYDKAEQKVNPFAFSAPGIGGQVVDLSSVEKLPPLPAY